MHPPLCHFYFFHSDSHLTWKKKRKFIQSWKPRKLDLNVSRIGQEQKKENKSSYANLQVSCGHKTKNESCNFSPPTTVHHLFILLFHAECLHLKKIKCWCEGKQNQRGEKKKKKSHRAIKLLGKRNLFKKSLPQDPILVRE